MNTRSSTPPTPSPAPRFKAEPEAATYQYLDKRPSLHRPAAYGSLDGGRGDDGEHFYPQSQADSSREHSAPPLSCSTASSLTDSPVLETPTTASHELEMHMHAQDDKAGDEQQQHEQHQQQHQPQRFPKLQVLDTLSTTTTTTTAVTGATLPSLQHLTGHGHGGHHPHHPHPHLGGISGDTANNEHAAAFAATAAAAGAAVSSFARHQHQQHQQQAYLGHSSSHSSIGSNGGAGSASSAPPTLSFHHTPPPLLTPPFNTKPKLVLRTQHNGLAAVHTHTQLLHHTALSSWPSLDSHGLQPSPPGAAVAAAAAASLDAHTYHRRPSAMAQELIHDQQQQQAPTTTTFTAPHPYQLRTRPSATTTTNELLGYRPTATGLVADPNNQASASTVQHLASAPAPGGTSPTTFATTTTPPPPEIKPLIRDAVGFPTAATQHHTAYGLGSPYTQARVYQYGGGQYGNPFPDDAASYASSSASPTTATQQHGQGSFNNNNGGGGAAVPQSSPTFDQQQTYSPPVGATWYPNDYSTPYARQSHMQGAPKQPEPILAPGEQPAPRPAPSYAALIGEALLLSPPPHQLYVSEISERIKKRYPYYRQNPSKIYNGVRHQTSMCKAFVKLPRPFGDQSGGARKWAIRAGCQSWFSPSGFHPPSQMNMSTKQRGGGKLKTVSKSGKERRGSSPISYAGVAGPSSGSPWDPAREPHPYQPGAGGQLQQVVMQPIPQQVSYYTQPTSYHYAPNNPQPYQQQVWGEAYTSHQTYQQHPPQPVSQQQQQQQQQQDFQPVETWRQQSALTMVPNTGYETRSRAAANNDTSGGVHQSPQGHYSLQQGPNYTQQTESHDGDGESDTDDEGHD